MINSKKLKDLIKQHGLKQENVAIQLGLKQSSFNQKINNVRPMFLSEAEKIAEILNIPDTEFGSYFFTAMLHSAQQSPTTTESNRKEILKMNMKITTTEVQEIECGSARLLQVIETKFARGTDEPGDPVREVTQYWSVDGELLAENEKPLDSPCDIEEQYRRLKCRLKHYQDHLIHAKPPISSCGDTEQHPEGPAESAEE